MASLLKRILPVVVLVCAMFQFSIAAECAGIIASKGTVKASQTGYETGKDSTLSIMAGNVRIDLLPETKIGPVACGTIVSLKLIKGAAWVRSGISKVSVSTGSVVLESSKSVFSLTPRQVSVYSGFVTVKNNKKITRVGRSMCLDFAAGKNTNISDAAAGDSARQVKMDKFTLYCGVNVEPKDYITARSTFAGAFTAFYHAGRALFAFDNPKEDYDLNMDLKIEKKGPRSIFNGIIKNTLTTETVAIFSVDETADEAGMQRGLTKAGIETARALQTYGSRILTEGTKVFVQMEGHTPEIANEIKQILEKNPAVTGLKYTDAKGKTGLYEMQFKGNGCDLAEILSNRKVQNKHINIWKNSKFVVKLTII